MKTPPQRIILDTDLAMGAGADIDDGFALALAHADQDIQLELVTTVNGNTDIESATILTGVLMDRLSIDPSKTPLVRGAGTPLMYTEKHSDPAPHVAAMKSTARKPVSGQYASVAIAEHIMSHPGDITVVAIGPLTNIAMAILLEPRIRTAIKELVIMGGVFFGTMYSANKPGEFNVFSDPEAARAVLNSGIPQRWIGLDVTLQVRLSMDDAERLKSSESEFSQFAGQASATYIDYQAERFPGRKPRPTSVPMHDPLAVACVARPELCEYRDMAVDVITGDVKGRGIMIGDRLEMSDPPKPNCRVAVSVNAEAFREYFLSSIQGL